MFVLSYLEIIKVLFVTLKYSYSLCSHMVLTVYNIRRILGQTIVVTLEGIISFDVVTLMGILREIIRKSKENLYVSDIIRIFATKYGYL